LGAHARICRYEEIQKRWPIMGMAAVAKPQAQHGNKLGQFRGKPGMAMHAVERFMGKVRR
jgi:hypothetical protein